MVGTYVLLSFIFISIFYFLFFYSYLCVGVSNKDISFDIFFFG